jgi:hypothetical protein
VQIVSTWHSGVPELLPQVRTEEMGRAVAFSLKNKRPAKAGRSITAVNYFLLTAFFRSTPGVNFATRRDAILINDPVCGLRPLRAFR